ncbi:thioredoxin domain-containing protein [Microbacterium sp. ASV49]|uniref:DUF255 domain-containing protein n=1 Tax=Microbacterium candidum TaxID=3041922 RepID=A0ABT7N1S0_9MICO|nr:DUF255 domain-containing protein [Microbacterium sp. ASV49]MDL9980658.1 DUF255 domain-containing protein [Microbacterium sp. ASV49]
MNERLATSASPYLRAHATNPVAWYPWGEEAFAEARRRDVPVFVSIGYSTCHWCHVMARESFADPVIAAELADGFVSVKVDREEHPEVDEAYLAAASAFTRSLGWPLSVFTTPDGRAFFAGTYFPPEPRGGMPSFTQVLAAVRQAWTERRETVDAAASAVVEALAEAGKTSASDLPTAAELEDAATRAASFEDPEFGGFAGSGADAATPKFPMAPALGFLHAAGSTDVVTRALAAMASSPLCDDVDGGFFRYATRRDWTEPHYERMLTDNAGLLDVALDAGRDDLARSIAGFLTGVLQQPSGGFAAAQDSESWIEGARSEGGYYRADAAGRADLEPPAIDGKIVTGWNGLAIRALARAGSRLAEPRFVEAARWAADAVLESNIADDGRLLRASLDDIPSRAAGTAEDAGLLTAGLCALAAATGEVAYAVAARDVLDTFLGISPLVPEPVEGSNVASASVRPLDKLGDRTPAPRGGWADPVLKAQGTPDPPDSSDSDHPSGPSALALGALALWLLGAGQEFREWAADIVRAYTARSLAEPLSHGSMLEAALLLARGPRHVVVVTDDPEDALSQRARGLPADVLAFVTEAQARAFSEAGLSLFEGKTRADGRATAYDCRDFVCRLPVTDPDELG